MLPAFGIAMRKAWNICPPNGNVINDTERVKAWNICPPNDNAINDTERVKVCPAGERNFTQMRRSLNVFRVGF
ncbi:hypothetical protein CEXT_661841 [Caerostris extrusa]|uniref:Uncharacterized protein n=1 Tax=Caerostris extrusa TaxID=172846 RepID=A0AAV4UPH7_CAEEX|nr:hypothetical protein CEXT_661841 [Caerostris extrusa]